MRLAICTSFLCLLLLASCTAPPKFYLGGIQVNEPDHGQWVRTLERHEFNTVAVTVYAHQGDWDSANLWFDDYNESVVDEIREAKAEGLAVVLILRVALDHAFERNAFLWHGMIMPRTDELLDEWFRRYTVFAERWAEIAEREDVDVFGIGSELNSLTSTMPLKDHHPLITFYLDEEQQRTRADYITRQADGRDAAEARGAPPHMTLREYLRQQAAVHRQWASAVSRGGEAGSLDFVNRRRRRLGEHWLTLIKRIRGIYSKRLLYAANFDQYQDVGFWQSLDYIGINAYFPLRASLAQPAPSAASIEAGWSAVLDEIARYRSSRSIEDKPVIFTELGYTFRRNCTVEPWSSDGVSLVGEPGSGEIVFWKRQPIDFQERIQALQALNAAQKRHPGVLKGVLYWKLSTIPAHLDIEPFVHILTDEQDRAFRRELVRLKNSS